MRAHINIYKNSESQIENSKKHKNSQREKFMTHKYFQNKKG